MPVRAAPKDDRRDARRSAGFSVVIHDQRLGRIPGVARNVSAGGLFVETALALPANTPVEIEVDGESSLRLGDRHLTAVVAHCADGGVGLMFATSR